MVERNSRELWEIWMRRPSRYSSPAMSVSGACDCHSRSVSLWAYRSKPSTPVNTVSFRWGTKSFFRTVTKSCSVSAVSKLSSVVDSKLRV